MEWNQLHIERLGAGGQVDKTRAGGLSVKWVMDQVGHSDSTMTMDVYAQLQQRADRQHGKNFDRLVCRAKKNLAGVAVPV